MKARLTFLSGPSRGARLILKDQTIPLGGNSANAIRFSGVPITDLLATIETRDCTYWITAQHPLALLRVNGEPTATRGLEDGDLIEIGGGHKLRFGTVPEAGDTCKPVRAIVRDSLRGAANLEAGAIRRGLFFIRDICHCTACDATRRVKLACVITCGVVLLGSLALGASLFRSQAVSDRQVVALSEQVAAGTASRRRLEQQIARLRQLEQEKARTQARLGEVSQDLETARQRLTRLERQTPDLLASIEKARGSVAFLLAGYALYEKASGKPLRFTSADPSRVPQRDEKGNYETSVDGAGPIVTSYVTGTGFVIVGGRIVTNRHVAEPWWGESSVDDAVRRGFEPRHTVARAYFPRESRPVELRPAIVSADADIAVMEGPLPGTVSPLKLAPMGRPVNPGDLIVVLGYPTGFDALLAKADEPVAQQILNAAGEDWPALATALADRRLITPLVTMGHVGDVTGTNVVYDAATTHGSSGGPVLNANGDVIAVNYAGLESFAGARFGIPIRLVHRLLSQQPGPRRAR